MKALANIIKDKRKELDLAIKKLPISAQMQINVFTQNLETIHDDSDLSFEEKNQKIQENLTQFKAKYGTESNK